MTIFYLILNHVFFLRSANMNVKKYLYKRAGFNECKAATLHRSLIIKADVTYLCQAYEDL